MRTLIHILIGLNCVLLAVVFNFLMTSRTQPSSCQKCSTSTETKSDYNHMNGERIIISVKSRGLSPPPMTKGTSLVVPNVDRTIYGGKEDTHLGGFLVGGDKAGISKNLWNFMLGILGVRSFLDVGCGRGYSTKYFMDKGADVLCVEGSHEAVTSSLLPADRVVEHDFSLGPWWPEKTYDACWSVEFLEHVGRHYSPNYLATLNSCALLFVTRSQWGGWHHVEIHPEWWWIGRLSKVGFIYSEHLTEVVRKQAANERDYIQRDGRKGTSQGQHLIFTLMVFVNPEVAGLKRHAHLIAGDGCFEDGFDNQNGGNTCTGKDKLPAEFRPLINCTRSLQKSRGAINSKLGERGQLEGMLWDCV